MQWFRFYSSVVHDPKVQKLHPAIFKHWVNILCLVSEYGKDGELPDMETVAFCLGLRPFRAESVVKTLIKKGLIDQNGDQLKAHAWDKRQMISDSSAGRVRKHRAHIAHTSRTKQTAMCAEGVIDQNIECSDNNKLQSNVTLPKHTVDTDTDTDKNKRLCSSDDEQLSDDWISKKKRRLQGKRLETFKLFWEAFDFKKGRAAAIDSWLDIPQLTNTLVEKIVKAAALEAKDRPDQIKRGKTPIWPQGWLTGRRWEDEHEEKQGQVDRIIDMSREESEQLQRVRAAYECN